MGSGIKFVEGSHQFFVDMIPRAGGGRLTELGIYKLEGDTLTICFNNPTKKERPKEFESKEGSGTALMVLKRVKK